MVWGLGPSVFVFLGFVYSLIECFSLSSFAFSVFLFPGFIPLPPPVFSVSCLVKFSCLLFPSFSVQSTFLSLSHVSCFNLIVPCLVFSFASSQFHVCVCVISPSCASLLALIPLLSFEYLVLCLPLPVVIYLRFLHVFPKVPRFFKCSRFCFYLLGFPSLGILMFSLRALQLEWWQFVRD